MDNNIETEAVMIVGKVVGSIISTRKSEKLVGNKFMIVEQILSTGAAPFRFVAIDNIGAGIGETVLVTTGSAARIGTNNEDAPVDAAIVGIVDEAPCGYFGCPKSMDNNDESSGLEI